MTTPPTSLTTPGPNGAGRPAAEPRARDGPTSEVGSDAVDDLTRLDEGTTSRDNTRHWVFATCGASIVVITIVALLIVNILTHARDDLQRTTTVGLPVQQELVDLRGRLFDYQTFIESHLDILAPGTTPSTAVLAQGVQFVQAVTTDEATLARTLRRLGLTTDAENFDAAIAAFNDANTKLTPIAAGQVVTTSTRARIVASERAAILHLWTLSSTMGRYLSAKVTGADAANALTHLRSARTAFLVAAIADLALVLGAGLTFGLRAGRRERVRRRNAQRRAYEIRLQKALDMTASEGAVYDILGESLHDSTARLKVEMLIADSSRAHFRRALSSAGEFEGCGVVSPVDCPAATTGQMQPFPSSGALDACPHLKARGSGPCSAVCFPVSIAGMTVGVMHAIGPDGVLPSGADISSLQFSSRRSTERIAMLRAFAASEVETRIDSLTGLLNRRSLENRVNDLRAEAVPYAVAYGRLDDFEELNDTHGREAGDQALRLFARVLRDSVRPNDITARNGDEDFLVVLPDCRPEPAVEVLERVRERLAIALTAGRVPVFTVTFGLASTAYATELDDIIAVAARALLEGRTSGHNRVIVATRPEPDRQAAGLS